MPLAIHSDAPVTPLGPCSPHGAGQPRDRQQGRTLGAHEKISVDEALRTITLGAAWTLKLDGEIGSIETGKRADFAVLQDDPTEIGAARLKDVRIWGTVQGGPRVRGRDDLMDLPASLPVTVIGGYLGAEARRRWSITCCAMPVGASPSRSTISGSSPSIRI